MGGMAVTEEGFAHLAGRLAALADRHADGRLVMVLEGGYNLHALARSVRACTQILTGAAPPPMSHDVSRAGLAALHDVSATVRRADGR
jgi:acetoin utilization deacetylase AcuC-like enzyme